MRGWRNTKGKQSTASRGATVPRVIAAAMFSAVILAGMQGCGSSSDSRLVDAKGPVPPTPAGQPAGQQEAWRQPSNFDADGPPSGTYRGGRDPVTGKAAEWSANGPVETSAIAPLPSPGRPSQVAPYSPPVQSQPSAGGAGVGVGILGKVKVRQGDTLESIAHAHGITVTALMQANRMTGRSSIKVGQQLVVPQ